MKSHIKHRLGPTLQVGCKPSEISIKSKVDALIANKKNLILLRERATGHGYERQRLKTSDCNRQVLKQRTEETHYPKRPSIEKRTYIREAGQRPFKVVT